MFHLHCSGIYNLAFALVHFYALYILHYYTVNISFCLNFLISFSYFYVYSYSFHRFFIFMLPCFKLLCTNTPRQILIMKSHWTLEMWADLHPKRSQLIKKHFLNSVKLSNVVYLCWNKLSESLGVWVKLKS